MTTSSEGAAAPESPETPEDPKTANAAIEPFDAPDFANTDIDPLVSPDSANTDIDPLVSPDSANADFDVPAPGAPPPKLPAFLLVLGVLSLLLGLVALHSLGYFEASSSAAPTLRGFSYDPPDPAPDFELIDASGQPFRLADSAGQARLLFFGFTHCPDVCPTTLARLSTALNQLGPEAASTRVLFVSVDPQRDTPERIGRYLAGFEAPMTGLTGPIASLEAMAADYHVAFFKDPPDAEGDDYTMVHSGTVFLIDPAGFLRASYTDPILPEDLAHDLKLVLAEQD